MYHKYRLPVRADSFIDELQLLQRISKLLVVCYALLGQVEMPAALFTDTQAFLIGVYQETLSLSNHPMRLFVMAQLERDLKECKRWLISEMTTEHDMGIHQTRPTASLARQKTVPKTLSKCLLVS